MSDKSVYQYEELMPVAIRILGLLKQIPMIISPVIAGSLRRKQELCHDIDFVLCHPDPALVCMTVSGWSKTENVKNKIKADTRIFRFDYEGYPVDLYIAPIIGEYGALLQMRTGPAEFNIRLCQQARKLGYKYEAGHGIIDYSYGYPIRKDKAGENEEEIFKALQIKFIPPEKRSARVKFEYIE